MQRNKINVTKKLVAAGLMVASCGICSPMASATFSNVTTFEQAKKIANDCKAKYDACYDAYNADYADYKDCRNYATSSLKKHVFLGRVGRAMCNGRLSKSGVCKKLWAYYDKFWDDYVKQDRVCSGLYDAANQMWKGCESDYDSCSDAYDSWFDNYINRGNTNDQEI